MQEIRNCQFAFQCPRTWDQLVPTKKSSERYCPACSQTVYLCRTPTELMTAIKKDRCVAVDVMNKSTQKFERLLGDPI